MRQLIERVGNEAVYLGDGIIKVDSIINHQLDPDLTRAMGDGFRAAFDAAGVQGVTRVLTAEVSGIAPALVTAAAYGVPMVFARKKPPLTLSDQVVTAASESPTKKEKVTLHLSKEYLHPHDRVLIIDDFLATGGTLNAMAGMVAEVGARLCGVGCVIEKLFANGRAQLSDLNVPVVSLVKIDVTDGNTLTVS
ncbi:MAG: xanthine phosphoribosyltransferase [Deltaproteobacteria bacterium]|nr:MAG: xanthine phosphoribosyltransferase [Deltaproteobacteria bacterium]